MTEVGGRVGGDGWRRGMGRRGGRQAETLGDDVQALSDTEGDGSAGEEPRMTERLERDALPSAVSCPGRRATRGFLPSGGP